RGAARRWDRAPRAVGQPARLPDLSPRAARAAAGAGSNRGVGVSLATLIAGVVQVAGGVLGAPAIVGLIQHLKARLQGRRGPPVLQPYRELARLWGKSG